MMAVVWDLCLPTSHCAIRAMVDTTADDSILVAPTRCLQYLHTEITLDLPLEHALIAEPARVDEGPILIELYVMDL